MNTSITQTRIKKFNRDPDFETKLGKRQITDRSFAIISILECYQILSSTILVKLVEGDERTTQRHLQSLYHKGLINRFCFFGPTGRPQEFNYFLDSPKSLDLLIEKTGIDPEAVDYEMVQRNRERWKPLLHDQRACQQQTDSRDKALLGLQEVSEGQRLFARHELMISRFHAALEFACRASNGRVRLAAWFQGPPLYSFVEAPKVTFRNNLWQEECGIERIPHRPDALFTLQIEGRPEASHFFYEADRKTTSTRRMIKKLRGHYHYIVLKRKQLEDYGISRIRAVLIETLDKEWAETLRQAAAHPIVAGNQSPDLFWFTASSLFARSMEKEVGRTIPKHRLIPYFIEQPQAVFKAIWFTPFDQAGEKPRSILI